MRRAPPALFIAAMARAGADPAMSPRIDLWHGPNAADCAKAGIDPKTLLDGLIATDGRQYAACSDGSLRCFPER